MAANAGSCYENGEANCSYERPSDQGMAFGGGACSVRSYHLESNQCDHTDRWRGQSGRRRRTQRPHRPIRVRPTRTLQRPVMTTAPRRLTRITRTAIRITLPRTPIPHTVTAIRGRFTGRLSIAASATLTAVTVTGIPIIVVVAATAPTGAVMAITVGTTAVVVTTVMAHDPFPMRAPVAASNLLAVAVDRPPSRATVAVLALLEALADPPYPSPATVAVAVGTPVAEGAEARTE